MRSFSLALVLAVACSLSACGTLFDDESPYVSDLRKSSTPGWGDSVRRPPSLLYLAHTKLPGGILFGHKNDYNANLHPVFYEYDFETKEISRSLLSTPPSGAEWEITMAVGTVGFVPRLEPRCQVGAQEGIRLRNDSFCLEPKGISLAGARPSPSAKFWFVLSADGEHRVDGPSIWGSGARSIRAYGQHYLQLVSVEDEDFVGVPIHIGMETARTTFFIDWVDDDHIVVAPADAHWIAIVNREDFTNGVRESE